MENLILILSSFTVRYFSIIDTCHPISKGNDSYKAKPAISVFHPQRRSSLDIDSGRIQLIVSKDINGDIGGR